MAEILFWTVAVFAILAGPPLIILWDLRREAKKADEQRRSGRVGPGPIQPGTGGRPSSTSSGLWPGMALVAWTL